MDALVELTEADRSVGGKAAGLARLAGLGLPVPPAVVLPTTGYARWRATGTVDRAPLAEALARLGTPLAVRSSALDEDAAGRSAAGQYESVMNVRSLDELVAAVERCYEAATGERAVAYRGRADAELALVVQREVPADRAAVAFTVDPVTEDERHVVLEVVFGHGARLVSGVVEPDRFRVAREGGPVRARVAEKPDQPPGRRFARTLRDDEARHAAALALEAERGFGVPVDLELCFDGPRVWLVQCRPITTLDAAA